MTQRILIAGIGNRLMSDDGFGSFLVEQLIRKRRIRSNCVEIVDYGISAISLFHDIADFKVVIFIDVIQRQKRPGTVYHFTLTKDSIDGIDMKEINEFFRVSFHEINLEKLLTLLRSLNLFPDYVELIGVEPEKISPGIGLSDTLKRSMKKVEDIIAALTTYYIEKLC